jgi:hypothetical protein
MEWNPDLSIEEMARKILSRRTDVQELLSPNLAKVTVTDDRPYNEYFILRRLAEKWSPFMSRGTASQFRKASTLPLLPGDGAEPTPEPLVRRVQH